MERLKAKSGPLIAAAAFPTTLASRLQFSGWICQETLCDRSSVTFDFRQCAANMVDVGHSPAYVAAEGAAVARHHGQKAGLRHGW